MYDAIVVGAGHNGLVAAWYVAHAGLNVLVLERRDVVGGAVMTEELWPGYRVHTCSYICYLLQARVIDDMQLREHGFEVYRLDPGAFTPFPDGRSIISWHDEERVVAQLAQFSERDAAAWPRFRALRTRMAAIVNRSMLTDPPTLGELVDDVRGTEDEALLERLLFGSVAGMLDEHFESEQVKGWLALSWDAGDPDAPGSLLSAIYPWVSAFSRDDDVGIVHGGMGGITQAMARSCRAAGVEIRTDAEVAGILVEGGRARGVTLTGGEAIEGRLVLSNADPKRTFLSLVPRDSLDPGFVRRIAGLKTRAVYFKFHAALSGLPDDPRILAHTEICPSLDYYRTAWDDASHGRITGCPVMDVQIPSVYDRSLVPDGGHVMSVWVQYAPVRPAGAEWTEELARQAGERLIDTLAEYAPNIRDVIQDWVCFTPADIERRVGMTDGQIRHIDMLAGQLFAQRPLPGWANYRTPIDGLYLCGAGTHPGGEVTGAPGHNAAQAVLREMSVAAGSPDDLRR
jgi:phytoene dehydrogenase-like protein